MGSQFFHVLDVTYYLHTKPDGSTVMEVRYKVGTDRTICEYLNFEDKYSRAYVSKWWSERSPDNVPKTNQHAVDSANYHAVAQTLGILVDGGVVVGCKLGEKPPSLHETW